MRQVKPILPVLQQAHPLAQGLVAAWLFFERGGTTLYDLSGNNNKGTLTGFPATPWTIDIHGPALIFDGTNNYVSIPSAFPIVGTGNYTVETWIKRSTTGTNDDIWVTSGTDALSLIVIRITSGNKINLNIRDSGGNELSGGNFLSAGGITDTTRWHHIVCTWDNGADTAKIYINGIIDATATGATTIANVNDNSSKFIGTEAGIVNVFGGTIGKFAVYKEALTAQNVAELYRDPWALFRPARKVIGFVSVVGAPQFTVAVQQVRHSGGMIGRRYV